MAIRAPDGAKNHPVQYNRNANFQKTAVPAQTQDSLHTLQARQTKHFPLCSSLLAKTKQTVTMGKHFVVKESFCIPFFQTFVHGVGDNKANM